MNVIYALSTVSNRNDRYDCSWRGWFSTPEAAEKQLLCNVSWYLECAYQYAVIESVEEGGGDVQEVKWFEFYNNTPDGFIIVGDSCIYKIRECARPKSLDGICWFCGQNF